FLNMDALHSSIGAILSIAVNLVQWLMQPTSYRSARRHRLGLRLQRVAREANPVATISLSTVHVWRAAAAARAVSRRRQRPFPAVMVSRSIARNTAANPPVTP